jgi:hypothetical protein
MKNPGISILSVCIILCSLSASAQNISGKTLPINEPDYNKPKLFADLPDRLNFIPEKISSLFDLTVGQSVNVPIAADFGFSGQVVSKSDDPKSSSVVIRSTNRLGARFIFTKITDESNQIKYIGRIISLKHADSYEIISENNQYYFKKKGIYDLMTE